MTVEALEKILSKKYSDSWAARRNDFSVLKLVAGEHNDVLSFIAEYVIDPVAELSKIDTRDDNDKIVISTIHSAKGLEADICYIINVAPGMYPSERAKTFDDIEEERRCLYVAMTRAKDVLYLMARNVSSTAFRTINKEDECSNDDAFFFNATTFFNMTLRSDIGVPEVYCRIKVLDFCNWPGLEASSGP